MNCCIHTLNLFILACGLVTNSASVFNWPPQGTAIMISDAIVTSHTILVVWAVRVVPSWAVS